ncbi:uncharacterized protein [Macaca nemestrina]|uniref:uncharacterized protein n=1 Tax=Macaca nemestrina TaxID=9545 RepID=UPI0039B97484
MGSTPDAPTRRLRGHLELALDHRPEHTDGGVGRAGTVAARGDAAHAPRAEGGAQHHPGHQHNHRQHVQAPACGRLLAAGVEHPGRTQQVAQVQSQDAHPWLCPQPGLGRGAWLLGFLLLGPPLGKHPPYPPGQRLPLIPSALPAKCSRAPPGIASTNHVPRANCVKKSMLQVAAASSSTCGGMRNDSVETRNTKPRNHYRCSLRSVSLADWVRQVHPVLRAPGPPSTSEQIPPLLRDFPFQACLGGCPVT